MTDELENAYQTLGLEAGPATTDAEIKKAYRKLALLKHPDKNPDNPNATDEFNVIQRAYDLLLDADARAALDSLLKRVPADFFCFNNKKACAVRAQRTAVHDEKRRRMAADLERRERAAEGGASVEDIARVKLQAEIERLRKEAAKRAQKMASAQPAAAAAPRAAPQAVSPEVADRLSRTLKVNWVRDGQEYSATDLRQIFSGHGVVEDVVVKEGKKKKGSALVVMATAQSAQAAIHSINGRMSNPLLVVPLAKGGETGGSAGGSVPAASSAHRPEQSPANMTPRPAVQTLGRKRSTPLFAAGAATSTGAPSLFAAGDGTKPSAAARFSSFKGIPESLSGPAAKGAVNLSYEDSILARLRQEAERKRKN